MLSSQSRWFAVVAATFGGVGLVVVLYLLFAGTHESRREVEQVRSTQQLRVPILRQYDTKIIYTNDTSTDAMPFSDDCRARGGTFNRCGNICAPASEVCAEVCAYTCELPVTP